MRCAGLQTVRPQVTHWSRGGSVATTPFRTSRLTCAGHSCSCCMQSPKVACHGWSGVQTTVVPRRVNRINKHRGLQIRLCMNPRRQPWSSSSRNNNDIPTKHNYFPVDYARLYFLKCGVQQTICFKPLAHRSVKLTFSGRLSLTQSCGELPGFDIDNTCTHVCLYQ